MNVDGYKVTTAENRKKALDQIEHNNFSAIVSDLRMPEIDGMKLLSALVKDSIEF